jgi:hypothetical protein
MKLLRHLFPDKRLELPTGDLPRRLSLLDIGARQKGSRRNSVLMKVWFSHLRSGATREP